MCGKKEYSYRAQAMDEKETKKEVECVDNVCILIMREYFKRWKNFLWRWMKKSLPLDVTSIKAIANYHKNTR